MDEFQKKKAVGGGGVQRVETAAAEGAILLLVTTSSKDEALRIARTLVDERLVACGQLVPGLTSIYRWQGSVHEDPEILLLMKTRVSLYDTVEERIKSLHSYDVPQIVAIPLARGSGEYLTWLYDQTQ